MLQLKSMVILWLIVMGMSWSIDWYCQKNLGVSSQKTNTSITLTKTKQTMTQAISNSLPTVTTPLYITHTNALIHRKPYAKEYKLVGVTISGYCHCTVCCGPAATGLTAMGRTPSRDRTVAAPRHIPLGSTIIMAGRRYVAEDRTAKRFDGRFDIYFSNHQAAKRFGRQTNTVTIITP